MCRDFFWKERADLSVLIWKGIAPFNILYLLVRQENRSPASHQQRRGILRTELVLQTVVCVTTHLLHANTIKRYY